MTPPRGQGKNPRPDPVERVTGSPSSEFAKKARENAELAEQQLADLDKQEAPMSEWGVQKQQLQLALANCHATLAVYYETRAARYG